jgi:chromosome segregation ATPase
VQDLQTAHAEYTNNTVNQASRLKRAEENAADFEARYAAAKAKADKAEEALVEKEKAREAVQSELDDLLMVFGDLEEKVERYKARLQELGETVSDGEDDGDEEEEDDDVD